MFLEGEPLLLFGVDAFDVEEEEVVDQNVMWPLRLRHVRLKKKREEADAIASMQVVLSIIDHEQQVRQ